MRYLLFLLIVVWSISGCVPEETKVSNCSTSIKSLIEKESFLNYSNHLKINLGNIDSIKIESMIYGGLFSIIKIKSDSVIVQDYFDNSCRTNIPIEYGQNIYNYIDSIFIHKNVPIYTEKIKREHSIISDFGFVYVIAYSGSEILEAKFDMGEESDYIFHYTSQFHKLCKLIEAIWSMHVQQNGTTDTIITGQRSN